MYSKLVTVCFFALSLNSVIFADEGSAGPHGGISVTGTATIKAVPDIIAWSLSTTDRNKDLLQAKEASDQKLRTILSIVRGFDVKPEDLQTGSLNVRREYERNDPSAFKEFVMTRSVTLRQRDLNRFDEFLTKLASSVGVEVNFTLETSRLQELRWDARRQAMEMAMKKAQSLAETSGAKLGKIISITEKTPQPNPWSRVQGPMSNSIVTAEPGASMGADAVSGTMAPGSIEIKESVEAVFSIG